jgi:hypothetical protein
LVVLLSSHYSLPDLAVGGDLVFRNFRPSYLQIYYGKLGDGVRRMQS